MFGGGRWCRWYRYWCSCLVVFDDDKVHSHHDTTRLHDVRVTDLITANLALLYISVDIDCSGCHDVYDKDNGRLIIGPLGGS